MRIQLAVCAAAVGCLPAPLDVTGKQCSADRGCGSGFYCAFGTCQPGDPPPPVNLLQNPDFEDSNADGGLPHWRTGGLGKLTAEHLIAHDGGSSARLTSTNADGGSSARLVADNVLDAGPYFFCATAWVYALAAQGSTRVTLNLGARYDGGTITEGGNSTTLSPSVRWDQISGNIDATQYGIPPDSISFTVSTSGFPAGDVLIIDDAWLWSPAEGTCP